MKYIKPELKIEKFSMIEDITADGESSVVPPWFIDEDNDDVIDIEGYTLGDAFGEALRNVFNF